MRHDCLRERRDHAWIAGSGGNERRQRSDAANFIGEMIKFSGDEPSCVEWIFADQFIDDGFADRDEIRRACGKLKRERTDRSAVTGLPSYGPIPLYAANRTSDWKPHGFSGAVARVPVAGLLSERGGGDERAASLGAPFPFPASRRLEAAGA